MGCTKIVETDNENNCLKESLWGDPLDNKILADIIYIPLQPNINRWLQESNVKSLIRTENFYNLKDQFPELFI